MAIYRAQIGWQMDSLMPRDVVTINPHFEKTTALIGGVGLDAEDFAGDLAQAILDWASIGGEVRVKLYDAQGTAPVFPVANMAVQAGVSTGYSIPPELAVCLSYYSGTNTPRRRGRLYIPAQIIGASMQKRPDATARNKVLSLGTVLANAGGADIDWVVYSRVDDDARPVTDAWVDDEWDVVRSRGLRATTRVAGTHSE